ncbi:Gfo/Idh/MocA family protein [Rothia uropygialis]|uniref:Gfo/Idh/MocA family protein n=1 Tax=Kocuria sp. 36 TaxID=1415402 RepID=UPI00101C3BAB|nr:Gfo/Idh/MocA family oxidoreductase [Kocuria sp. 36]
MTVHTPSKYSKDQNKQIRIGIIGVGTQGSFYASFVSGGRVPHMVLGALCDIDEHALSAAAQAHPGVPVFSSVEDALDSGAVDAIVTCVPHYDHSTVAITALSRGIPTLVEKPAAVHTDQVHQMIEASNEHPEVPFAIMFNQRTNPMYRRIKEIVSAGEIGQVLRSSWVITTWWRPQAYYDQSPWRATWGGEGGGVLVNQAPHQLDLWQWICGVPLKVFAKAGFGFARDITVEDEVTALVDYGDGRTGTFVTATHDMQGTDRFEILGSRGKIVVDGSTHASVLRYPRPEREISDELTREDVSALLSGRGAGLEGPVDIEVLDETTPWGVQHCEVLENFAQTILGQAELIAPAAEGVNAVRLANAIHLSAWTGREVDYMFDEETYFNELNRHIVAEGLYPQRENH